MAHLAFALMLCLPSILKIAASTSEKISFEIHSLPYWIQDSLFEYADEIGGRNLTGPIRKIYRKDLNPSYVAYYEFEFGNWFMTFSAGPETGDHRLVEQGRLPRTTDILFDQAAEMRKDCHKFFRLNADGTTICEDVTGQAVASTMDLETLTTGVNITNLHHDIGKSLKDFEEEWKKLAKEIRSSLEWKEMSVYSQNSKSPPTHRRTTIYKVLTLGESQDMPIGTPDVSAVEIKALFPKGTSNLKKRFLTLCLLLDNICSDGGKVNISSILRKKSNLDNLSYITIVVIDDYESFSTQLNSLPTNDVYIRPQGDHSVSKDLYRRHNGRQRVKAKSIDFYLKLTVAGKFVAVRHYTISLSHKRNKRSSWSGFTEFSIPYENLMPDYNQHICCENKCYSGSAPVAWAQIFAYYDRVAHTYGHSRYSTSLWSGVNGDCGNALEKAPKHFNNEVKKYIEALRVPLGTFCNGKSGSTYSKNNANIETWFRQRQVSGRVIILSRNINQQVIHYIKKNYPVINIISQLPGSKENAKFGRSVVVTKVKERSRKYKSCRKVGWWLGKKTKCDWKTEYEYEWYRRMGLGGPDNNWYSPSAKADYGGFVAVV